MKPLWKFAAQDREPSKLEEWLIDKQLEMAIARGEPVKPFCWWENALFYGILALFAFGVFQFYFMGV